jgi:hypothetical protein
MQYYVIAELAKELTKTLNNGGDPNPFGGWIDPRIVIKLHETDRANQVKLWAMNKGTQARFTKLITFNSLKNLTWQVCQSLLKAEVIHSHKEATLVEEAAKLQGYEVAVAVRVIGLSIDHAGSSAWLPSTEAALRYVEHGCKF